MKRDPVVELVVAEVSAPLAEDGGGASVIGVEDGVAHVAYRMGHNEECPECIMSPDDMREYIREALDGRAPHIRDVAIVSS